MPEVKVRFWLAASVVLPLRETAPVPVENVPVPFCVMLPAPDVSVKFLPAASVTSPLSEIAPVPVEKVPLPEMPKLPEACAYAVTPDNPPAAEMPIVGEVRMLLKPVPTVNALKVLFVCVVTLPKLIPVNVSDPPALSVPVKLIPKPLTAVVLDESESVALIVVADAFVLLTYVWVRVPVPEESVKFLLAAIVVLPLREIDPVPVERVVEPVWLMLPASVKLPFSKTVNLDEPPDLISRAVLVAALVSSMINDGAVPALVRVNEVAVPESVD